MWSLVGRSEVGGDGVASEDDDVDLYSFGRWVRICYQGWSQAQSQAYDERTDEVRGVGYAGGIGGS